MVKEEDWRGPCLVKAELILKARGLLARAEESPETHKSPIGFGMVLGTGGT